MEKGGNHPPIYPRKKEEMSYYDSEEFEEEMIEEGRDADEANK